MMLKSGDSASKQERCFDALSMHEGVQPDARLLRDTAESGNDSLCAGRYKGLLDYYTYSFDS